MQGEISSNQMCAIDEAQWLWRLLLHLNREKWPKIVLFLTQLLRFGCKIPILILLGLLTVLKDELIISLYYLQILVRALFNVNINPKCIRIYFNRFKTLRSFKG